MNWDGKFTEETNNNVLKKKQNVEMTHTNQTETEYNRYIK